MYVHVNYIHQTLLRNPIFPKHPAYIDVVAVNIQTTFYPRPDRQRKWYELKQQHEEIVKCTLEVGKSALMQTVH